MLVFDKGAYVSLYSIYTNLMFCDGKMENSDKMEQNKGRFSMDMQTKLFVVIDNVDQKH